MNLDLYKKHLVEIESEWMRLLDRNEYDSALIVAGENSSFYSDDQSPPFHANPHFLRWTVCNESEHCALVIRQGKRPQLHWYTPKDYWYLPSQIPPWLEENFECVVHDTVESLNKACTSCLQQSLRTAYVGPQSVLNPDQGNVGMAGEQFLNQLAYLRAYKTTFEVSNLKSATDVAVAGHLAAYQEFEKGSSEFDIHMAYLNGSRQAHHELPYPSIVALNEHASTLHYQHYERVSPNEVRSLLIDAGGQIGCYHSDVTRTYSSVAKGEFADLLATVDEFQQKLISAIDAVDDFGQLHLKAHELVANALVEHAIVTCSPTAAFEQQLTDTFYPHGTGHLLGLQTHDIGGHIVAEDGATKSPPKRFPSLRLTRKIEQDLVFTVEPGIYFIPVLLNQVRGHKDINWEKVERLIPYGGIRVEDNVLVEDGGVYNFTRTAFEEANN